MLWQAQAQEQSTTFQLPDALGGRPGAQQLFVEGEGFGSASLAIHEPQCMKKWEARNEQLPKGQREPRPVKP